MPTALFAPGSDDVLVVVDLSAQLFRAYHAIRPLSSPTGEPTHAVYGVVTILERLIKDMRPKRLAIALDSGRQTFRSDLYPEYKANRPEPPEDLLIQLRRANEIVRAFTPHVWQKAGYEADDLIATAVRRARAAGLRTLIIGADKDLMQLVGSDVQLWDTMRDRVIGPEEVFEKFAVQVDQLGDLLALMGDSSDNIPGVAGIGPKTAAELLTAYGTLDGIYAHLADLPRKRIRTLLAEHEAMARLSRRLVTLADDCDPEIDPNHTSWSARDVGRLRTLYAELGFTRLAQALSAESRGTNAEQASGAPPSTTSGSSESSDDTAGGPNNPIVTPDRGQGSFDFADAVDEPLVLDSLGALANWLDAAQDARTWAISLRRADDHATRSPWIALGIATNETRFAAASIAREQPGKVVSGQNGIPIEQLCALLRDRIRHDRLEVLTHGAKTLWLSLLDMDISDVNIAFDTELASYLLDPEQMLTLPALHQRYLGNPPGHLITKPSPRNAEPISDGQLFADIAERARIIYRLCRVMRPRIVDEGLDQIYYHIELPLCRVLARMQRVGVLVDTSHLAVMSAELDREIARLEHEAIETAGHPFNLNSPRQLETILFDELGLKPLRRTKTSRSTDAATLEALAEEHPLPRLILAHRQVAKLKSTYVDALPALVDKTTGRVHSSWEQVVTATGRLSSTDPNLQNIPIRTELGRAIRRAFVAPEGTEIVSADYSQIELRVLAHLSQDPELLLAFQANQDVHLRTAAAVFDVDMAAVTREMRRQAKAVNFGVIYGQTESGLASALGIPRHQASEFIAAYYRRYRGVREFMNRTIEQARHGKAVRSLFGRRRYFNDIDTANRSLRLAAERMAMNMPIQATAADLLKMAMLKLDEPVTPGARMIMSVHDELVFEVPREQVAIAKSRIAETMQDVAELTVKLLVEVGHGTNWAEAH
jgi:DNA polymerase I